MSLEEVLKPAVRERWAVGAFNIASHDMAEGVVQAAEAAGLPVIVNVAEVHFPVLEMEEFIHYLRGRMSRSPVPLVLHLDHGHSFSGIMQAIHYGFSSVMLDASKLSYADNAAQTREIVRIAHAAGVSVEAELGHVGGLEGDRRAAQAVDETAFTDPEEAERFVAETGVDALAVAVGTVHGIYQGEPQLDFRRIAALRERLTVPLVLHGGTGLSAGDFRQAVAAGINKINYYTGLYGPAVQAVQRALEAEVGYPELCTLSQAARAAVKHAVAEQIEVFGTRPLTGYAVTKEE